MSCILLSDEHLSALVQKLAIHAAKGSLSAHGRARFDYDVRTPAGLSEIGQILRAANGRAYDARYGDADIPAFELVPVPASLLHSVQILKACDCYDYQASDDCDYSSSLAAVIIDRIRYHATSTLPGYADAAWTIDCTTAGR